MRLSRKLVLVSETMKVFSYAIDNISLWCYEVFNVHVGCLFFKLEKGICEFHVSSPLRL